MITLPRLSKGLIFILYVIAFWVVLRFIIPKVFMWLLPIALAYCVSCAVRPIAQFLSKKYHVREKAAHVISFFFITLTSSLLTGYLVMRITTELVKFAREVPSYLEGLPDFYSTGDKIRQTVQSVMPDSLSGMITGASATIEDSLRSALSSISGNILSGVADFAGKLPDLGLFIIVFILCSYFFSVDYNRISVVIMRQVPKQFREKTIMTKDFALWAVLKYLRGMLTMSFIVYILILIGFTILKIDYAYLTAFLVALVDFFPLLGTGIVLIPWGIICLITGRMYTGLGILSLWGVVMLLRQLTEPKIMGKALGLHPLVTLLSAYTGYKIYGISGAILFPIVILVLFHLHRSGVINLNSSQQKKPSE